MIRQPKHLPGPAWTARMDRPPRPPAWTARLDRPPGPPGPAWTAWTAWTGLHRLVAAPGHRLFRRGRSRLFQASTDLGPQARPLAACIVAWPVEDAVEPYIRWRLLPPGGCGAACLGRTTGDANLEDCFWWVEALQEEVSTPPYDRVDPLNPNEVGDGQHISPWW